MLFICVLIPYVIRAGTLEEGIALNANLSSGYDKNLRPVKDQTNTVVVDIALYPIALQEFDEVLERFSIVGVLLMTWTDENLVWNASDYGGINTTGFGYKEVWVPELILTNPSEKMDSFGKEWQRIRYSSDGKALWNPGTLIQATCSVNAYYFPFDIQECYLEIICWGYLNNEVTLNASSNTIDLSFMSKHGTWEVIGTRVEITNSGTKSGTKSKARYFFRLERKPQYVIINIVMPILFLNLLNVLVFLLPAESGERVSYSVTVLLSIAVLMTIVSDALPRTSEPLPVISYLLLGSFIVSSTITVITVLNLRLFNRKEIEDVPTWLVKVYHNLMLCGWKHRCGKRKVNDNGLKDTRVAFHHHVNEGNHSNSSKTAMSVKDIDANENNNHALKIVEESFDSQGVTWQDISSMVDYVSLIIATVVIILSFTLFLIVNNLSAK